MNRNRFIPLISNIPKAVPTASGMYDGELAVNIADGKLYTKSGSFIIALNEFNTEGFVSSSLQVINLIDGYEIRPSIVSASFFAGNLLGTASVANTALQVLQQNFTGSFTGSFTGNHIGNGSSLTFETINTSQSSDSVLVVGNIYNNYENKQTTVFRNGDVVVSGSTYIGEDGLLVFSPREAPATFISGGMFYSSSGEFFVGIT
jgi:hypothetical protein